MIIPVCVVGWIPTWSVALGCHLYITYGDDGVTRAGTNMKGAPVLFCVLCGGAEYRSHFFPFFNVFIAPSTGVAFHKVSEFISAYHDDVIKWKHFCRYWPFVQGIHRSPVNSPHKGQWCGALMFSLICTWHKWLSKQARCRWFEMPLHSLWRHYNAPQGPHSVGGPCWPKPLKSWDWVL